MIQYQWLQFFYDCDPDSDDGFCGLHPKLLPVSENWQQMTGNLDSMV